MMPVVLVPHPAVYEKARGVAEPFDQDFVVELYNSVVDALGPLAVLVAPAVMTASALAPNPAPINLGVRALPPVFHDTPDGTGVGENTANEYVPGSFHARYVYPLSIVTVPP
jgi:hypothetical protein